MENRMGFKASCKERWRKFLVSLKRQPSIIPMVMLLIAFLVYSLNLSSITNTTDKISRNPMGLMSFITFLFSILSFVCLLNAFPKREPVKVAMLVLFFAFLVIIFTSDIVYFLKIIERLNDKSQRYPSGQLLKDIKSTQAILIVHMILDALTLVVTALLPIYSKLLKKINTSIEVAGNNANLKIDVTNAD